MYPTIIKRDGSHAAFDAVRITQAVSRAAEAAGVADPARFSLKVTDSVCSSLKGQDCADIQLVQTQVEDALMEHDHGVARAYVEYRHDRDVARERHSSLFREIRGLVEQTDADLLNENANKDSRILPTQRDLLAGTVAKAYARKHILPREVVKAHDAGEIHYHDLDYAPFTKGMFNCMLVDLEGMLTRGFKMGNADIESPRSIHTATAVTAQIIAQVASHIYGGTTIHRIDQVLAPYVKASYDKHLQQARQWQVADQDGYARALTEKECFDAFQSLEYEVNTLQSANGQTPFVTFGISGYDTSWEARLITQSIFKVRMRGLGREGKTPIFPKLVYTLREGYNRAPGDPNYDLKQLALECASKRIYPDILNYDKVVEITGSYKTPMGCRSFLNRWTDKDGNEVHEGRNNLGVVSLNLPRIGLEAEGDPDRFWPILEQRLAVAKAALLTRIQRFEGVTADVAPILYMHGACGVRLKPKDPVLQLFQDGRASISLGYIGIHETINALFANENRSSGHIFDDRERQAFAQRIVTRLRDAVEQWKQDSGFGFSLYATPSESLCHRFARLDAAKFGVIEGVTGSGYYTNSFHLSVSKQVNPFDKLDFEMPYPAISNGGFINYVESPNLKHNLQALEDLWDYSYSRVPYFGVNQPVDVCYACGFEGEFAATSKGFVCPSCGNHDPEQCQTVRRVCGYLGAPDTRPFNAGKQEEVKRRVKHQDA